MSIRFDSVFKRFGAKEVLRGVTFEVNDGEILFVLGRSGMGKSVVLKHIVGMHKPDRGHVFVEGRDVTTLDDSGLAEIRKVCGMVFQHPALLDSLTVFDNVAFGLRNSRLPSEKLRKIVLDKLRLVHLSEEVAERYPAEISYGMQKRVSLARTLAPQPRTLLFDEPTTGLDPITTQAVNSLIRDLSRTLSVTSVVVSHDMSSALNVADRILVLDEGSILALGTPSEIKTSPIPLIRDFLAEVS